MSTEHSPNRSRRLCRWPEVHKRYGKSRTQTWRDVRAGKFPAPVQSGPNSIGWWSDELDAHDETLPRVAYAPDEEVA
jgi:predicted DNA-binding transcriptional regulator AlpA